MRPLSLAAPLAFFLVLAGCASKPVMQDGIRVNDPYEAQNRRVHAFNKAVDARVIGPVSRRPCGKAYAGGGEGASDSV